jgi:hypothetical protein
MPVNAHFKAINQIIWYGIGFLLTFIKSKIYSLKMDFCSIALTDIYQTGKTDRNIRPGKIKTIPDRENIPENISTDCDILDIKPGTYGYQEMLICISNLVDMCPTGNNL